MISPNALPKLLVTGANGFVGRALCNAAQQEGYLVKAVSRRPHAFAEGVVNVVIPDYNQEADWVEVFKNVDVVVHLAARVHEMRESLNDDLSAYRSVNVDGTLRMAQYAASAGVHRFIFLSSIKVNGESTEDSRPFAFDDAPAPEDPYGVSKLEAEQALQALSQKTGMEVTIIRPPLVYGPGVGANFAAMMRWLSYRLPLPLGAIPNLRSMVALENLLDLILVCANHPAAKGQVFLVSDGQDISVTNLLQKIAAIMGNSCVLIPVPPPLLRWVATIMGRKNVAKRLCDSLQVDIGKTCKTLDWSPPISMDEGLRKTVNWYLEL